MQTENFLCKTFVLCFLRQKNPTFRSKPKRHPNSAAELNESKPLALNPIPFKNSKNPPVEQPKSRALGSIKKRSASRILKKIDYRGKVYAFAKKNASFCTVIS